MKTANRNMIRIVFFGTPAFAALSLQALLDCTQCQVLAVVTQPDRPAGRGKHPTPSPVKTLALSHSIPVLQPNSINKEKASFINQLTELGAIDLGVVVAFGQILPLELLQLPKAGCVNVHASLLPRWRGAAPIQRAIMAGDQVSGVALMQMEVGLDTGAVYTSSTVKITAEMDAGTLHDLLANIGAQLLVKSLSDISAGKLKPTPQPEQGVTYAEKINNEEASINWTLSSAEIVRLVLALAPYPGAYTLYNQQRLKIFKVRAVQDRKGLLARNPGEIYFQDSRTLEVQSGDGILAIEDLQLAGKKRMGVSDFLRGVSQPIISLGA